MLEEVCAELETANVRCSTASGICSSRMTACEHCMDMRVENALKRKAKSASVRELLGETLLFYTDREGVALTGSTALPRW